MNKTQIVVLASAIALLLGIYFLPTRPPKQDATDRSRTMAMETTDKLALLKKTGEKYTPEQLSEIRQLTDLVESSDGDSVRLGWLEKLSGAWYRLGEPVLAGIYAQEIAELRNDEQSWGIAGTTYGLGIKKHKETSTRQFCQKRAVQALENAISINPDRVSHRINLALCYVDMPPANQPMKGILMLRDLLDKYPNDVGVLSQLGGLAIQTGQYEKAVERLGKAYELAPKNVQVMRLLRGAYQGLGNTAKAQELEGLIQATLNQ